MTLKIMASPQSESVALRKILFFFTLIKHDRAKRKYRIGNMGVSLLKTCQGEVYI